MKSIKEYLSNSLQNPWQQRLNARGAEMIEYALVVACVCAVGALTYMIHKGTSYAYFKVYVSHLWENVALSIKAAL